MEPHSCNEITSEQGNSCSKLLLSSLGIGNTGEDSSSNTRLVTPSSGAAEPTTAGTRDTGGMEDIVAVEQVTTAAGD